MRFFKYFSSRTYIFKCVIYLCMYVKLGRSHLGRILVGSGGLVGGWGVVCVYSSKYNTSDGFVEIYAID